MKITHKMIAEATGFTQSTVSKALSSTGRISEETAAIIRKTANDMGYYSQSRRNFRNREAYLFPRIAILVAEIISWHYSNIITKLQEQIEWLGGSVCVYVTGFDNSNIERHIEQINRQNHFDGIVVLPLVSREVISDIPVIYTEKSQNTSDLSGTQNYYVYSDIGSDLAIRHLAELGHTKIGFIGEKNTLIKLVDFRRHMADQGLEVNEGYIYTSHFRFERIGHDGIQAFHLRGAMPTGILCAYDEVAFGAIEELEKLGYRVPEDVSVIGINNIDYCTHFKPPLTTLQENLTEHIAKIMEIIQNVVINENRCDHVYPISTELIVRSSTAPYSK